MAFREIPVGASALVVALAAVLGGAYYPGPRIVIGGLMAVTLGSAAATVRGRLRPEEWAFLGFVVWGLVAAAAAASAPLAARETLAVWLIAWGLWLFSRRVNERSARFGMIALAAAAVILSLGVMLEAAEVGRLRVAGLLENPNIAAALLVAAIPLLLQIDARPHWKFAAGGCVLLGLLVTGSRAGLLAALAIGVVVLPGGRPKSFALLAGAVGVAGVLVWRFLNQPDILAWFRPAIWAAVLRIWGARPLVGVGPGGLVDAAGPERLLHADHVGQHQFLIAYAESTPLAILVQTGLVGLSIAGGAIVLWWLGQRRRDPMLPQMRAAMVAMVVMGAFHDLLTVDVVLWWWALTMGLMEAPGAPLEVEADGRTTLPAARIMVGLTFAFVVLWGVVQPSWARSLWRSTRPEAELLARATRADIWYDAPLEQRSRGLLRSTPWSWRDAAEAMALSQEAVRIHPGAARLWSLTGIVHARVVTDLGPWGDSIERARGAFAHAVELEPHQPWTWLEWARLERNLGDAERAVGLVTRALEEEPHTVRARLFLARLLLDLGKKQAAREAFDEALQSAQLRSRRGLNAYERELLSAPAWQFQELEGALR